MPPSVFALMGNTPRRIIRRTVWGVTPRTREASATLSNVSKFLSSFHDSLYLRVAQRF
jgi:hypothetical protein